MKEDRIHNCPPQFHHQQACPTIKASQYTTGAECTRNWQTNTHVGAELTCKYLDHVIIYHVFIMITFSGSSSTTLKQCPKSRRIKLQFTLSLLHFHKLFLKTL